MKRFTVLAFVAGLSVLGLLVAFSGAADVLDAVAAAGWGTLIVVGLRAVAVSGDGVAWRFLMPARSGLSALTCVLLRWVREGINQLLPVAQVGGDIVGARLATFWGTPGPLAGAGIIVDVAIQASTQFAFAAVGLALLAATEGDTPLVRTVAAGLLVAAFALLGFFLVQRREGSRLFGRFLRSIAGGRDWLGVTAVEKLYEGLSTIYRRPGAVAACTALHMAIWFVGSLEVWVALRFMGHPVTLAEAVVVESLGQAVRGAAFAVPGALGVQEGGFIALCALFGVPAGPALALSLLKRVADLGVGAPGLVAWQVIEGRRWFRRSRPPAPATISGREPAELAS